MTIHNIVPNNTKKGKCQKCGECCGNFLPISKNDIQRIKEYIKINNIQAVKHFPDKRQQRIMEKLEEIAGKKLPFFDFSCPFLTNQNKCNIYSIRPLICRIYKCNMITPSWKDSLLATKEEREHIDMRYVFFGDSQGFAPNSLLKRYLFERGITNGH